MIIVNNLNRIYQAKSNHPISALANINLHLDDIGLVFIVGKSGSGKSTLLNLLGGLDKPTSGTINIDGVMLSHSNEERMNSYRRNQVSFVFQDYGLIDNMSVRENVLLGTDFQGIKVITEQLQAALDKFGLDDLASRKIYELSGGQKQRVALVRAFLRQTKLILADEPTGSLDEENGNIILNALKELAKDRLVIVVSHDLVAAQKYADRIISLRDGKIINDQQIRQGEFKGEKIRVTVKNTKWRTGSLINFGFHQFTKKLPHLVFSLILAAIAFSVGAAGLSFISPNAATTVEHSVLSEQLPIVSVKKNMQWEDSSQEGFCWSAGMTEADITRLQDRYNSPIIPVIYAPIALGRLSHFSGVTENNLYLDRSGYIFDHLRGAVELTDTLFSQLKTELIAGSLPETDTDVLITSYTANEFIGSNFQDPVNSSTSLATVENYDELIGHYLSTTKRICGIIRLEPDARFQQLNTIDLSLGGKNVKKWNSLKYQYINNYEEASVFNLYFVRDGFYKRNYTDNIAYQGTIANVYYIRSWKITLTNEFNQIINVFMDGANVIYAQPTIHWASGINPENLADNQVVVSDTILTQLLGEDSIVTSINYNKLKGINLKFLDHDFNGIISPIDIVGYYNSSVVWRDNQADKYVMYANSNLFTRMSQVVGEGDFAQGISIFSQSNQRKQISFLDNHYSLNTMSSITVDFPVLSASFFAYISSYIELRVIFGYLIMVGIVALILAIFILFNRVNHEMKRQRRNMGIMLAAGASKREIFRAYLFENIFLSLPVVFSSLLIAWGVGQYVNYFVSTASGLFLTMMLLSGWIAFVVIIAIFLTVTSATIFAMAKLMHQSPMDLLRIDN